MATDPINERVQYDIHDIFGSDDEGEDDIAFDDAALKVGVAGDLAGAIGDIGAIGGVPSTSSADVIAQEGTATAFQELKEFARQFKSEQKKEEAAREKAKRRGERKRKDKSSGGHRGKDKKRRKERRKRELEGEEDDGDGFIASASDGEGGYFGGEDVIRTGDIQVDEDGEEIGDNPVDMAMAALKANRHRSSTLGHTKEATELLALMDDAVKRDRDANKRGEPAVNMLILLPKVNDGLMNRELASDLVECGVLGRIGDWLWPLPDRSLPPTEIRTTLLKRLLELPVNEKDITDDMAGSCGPAVRFIRDCKSELLSNRRLARSIMAEWMRAIQGLHTDHRIVSDDMEEVEVRVQLPRAMRGGGRGSDGVASSGLPFPKRGEPGYTHHAVMPAPAMMTDLMRRPKSVPVIDGAPRIAEARRAMQFQKKHQVFLRAPKRVATAAKVKIGAGLT